VSTEGWRESSPARLVPWLSGLYLLAHFGSYALVNTLLVCGVVAALASGEVRTRLRSAWPGRVGPAALALVAWVLVSMAASPESWVAGADLSFRTALKPFLALILGIAAVQVAPGLGPRLGQWMGWFAVVFMVPALPSIHQWRISLVQSVYGKEILGPNVLGGILVLCLLQVLCRWQTGEEEEGWEKYARACFLLIGLVLTGSRSALIMLAGGLLTMAFWELSWKGLGKLLGGGLLLYALLAAANPRFRAIGGASSLAWELGTRGFIWGQAIDVIERRPVLGCGARRYRDKLDELGPDWMGFKPDGTLYGTDDTSLLPDDPLAPGINRNPLEAHNDYLTMAAQHGIPASVLWVLLHLAFLGAFWPRGKAGAGYSRAMFAVVFGAGAYTLFNAVWFNKELSLFLYWFVGAGLGEGRETAAAAREGEEPACPAEAPEGE